MVGGLGVPAEGAVGARQPLGVAGLVKFGGE